MAFNVDTAGTVPPESIDPFAVSLSWSLDIGNTTVWPQNDLRKGAGLLWLGTNNAAVDTFVAE